VTVELASSRSVTSSQANGLVLVHAARYFDLVREMKDARNRYLRLARYQTHHSTVCHQHAHGPQMVAIGAVPPPRKTKAALRIVSRGTCAEVEPNVLLLRQRLPPLARCV
jgi:hypothetical protein